MAEQRGWTVTAIYAHEGISGAKGRDKRPGLDAMLKNATRGRFDVAMCWAVDRIGRSLADLIGLLSRRGKAQGAAGFQSWRPRDALTAA